jgi:hypothetical protein
MQNIWRSRSLYSQILFVILAFVLVGLTAYALIVHRLDSYLEKNAEDVLAQTQIKIMDEFHEAETLMILIADEVRNIIVKGGSPADVRKHLDWISAKLRAKEQGFVFDGLHFYFEKTGIYLPSPGWMPPSDFDPTKRPWYRAAVEANGKIVPSPVYFNVRSRKYQITFVSRIFDDKGDPLGVVAMNVSPDSITNLVTGTRLTEDGYGFLINAQFEVITHPELGYITRPCAEVGFDLEKLLETTEKTHDGIARFELDNYRGVKSVFHTKEMDNGWYLGVVTPVDQYRHDLKTLSLLVGALNMLLVALIGAILISIGRAKTERTKRVRNSNWNLC